MFYSRLPSCLSPLLTRRSGCQVLELRQRAEDYRKRAQGTHFSREHLAQILAQQARLWDESSTATSTVSSLSAPSLDDGPGPANGGPQGDR